jgi:type IV pilus assembly protein PilB
MSVVMIEPTPLPWLPLGSLLVRAGKITTEQLELALVEQQQQRSRRLGEILVEWGWTTGQEIALALSEQWGLAYLDLAHSLLDPAAAALIDRRVAEQCQALPVRFLPDGVLLVAVGDPTDLAAVERVRETVGTPIRVAVVDQKALEAAYDRVYGPKR